MLAPVAEEACGAKTDGHCFIPAEWETLCESRRKVIEFTFACSHYLLEGIRTPALCLIIGKTVHSERISSTKSLYFGLICPRRAVTTLGSRIKVRRCVYVRPDSEEGLQHLVTEKPYTMNLADRLQTDSTVVRLSPNLGATRLRNGPPLKNTPRCCPGQ